MLPVRHQSRANDLVQRDKLPVPAVSVLDAVHCFVSMLLLLQEEWREDSIEAHGEVLSLSTKHRSSSVTGAGAWAQQQLSLSLPFCSIK